MHKSSFISKIRVEEERRELYERAHALRQRTEPDLTLSDWVRNACDSQARADLGLDAPKGVRK